MSTSILPTLIDALVTTARADTTLAGSGVLIYDGFGLSDDPGPSILMIGVDDADSPAAAASVDSQQAAATAGTNRTREETGEIRCVALSMDGGGDAKTARDAAYIVFGAVESFLRSDPRVGLTAPSLLVAEIGGHQLAQDQFNQGAGAWITFTITFRARI